MEVAKAGCYEGKRVVAQGLIKDAVEKEKATVLGIEGDLSVVIFSYDLSNFEFFGIEPAEYYVGKEVKVTGRVRIYKGQPEIVVDHPMLMEVTK